ncbi:MAG: alpha/beta hydrolase [Rhodospirillales bacterium]
MSAIPVPLPATLSDWFQGGRYLSLCGEEVFLREAGEGEPLLLLHAYPTASWGFHRIWPDLTARYRVLAPDLPGSGFSSKPLRGDYSLGRLAKILEALLEARGIDRVHILAHGYSGSIAQELLARSQGAVVASLCFVTSGLFPAVFHLTAMQRLLLSPLGPVIARYAPQPYAIFSRRLAETFGPDNQPSSEDLAAAWHLLSYNRGQRAVPRVIGYLRERKQRTRRLVTALEETATPLALLASADDPLSGRAVTGAWRRHLPRAPLYELPPKTGHYAPLECPAAVLDAYAAFREAW